MDDSESDTPDAPIPFARPPRVDEDAAKFEARVLRAFVRDGRLASIPAQDRKRRVILAWLLETGFPEDVAYVERDVNMRLALRHPDVAALRRYLVEAGLMTRSAGVYRRTAPAAASGDSSPS